MSSLPSPASPQQSQRIPSNFDWRPYIEVKGFPAHEQQRIEKALDNLAAHNPSFSYTIKAASSPEMLEHHSNLLTEYNNRPSRFGSSHPASQENSRSDYTKLIIQNSNSNPKFNALTRSVELNINNIDRLRLKDSQGAVFQPSLEHILDHELEHAGKSQSYTAQQAKIIADNKLLKRTAQNPVSTSVAKELTGVKYQNQFHSGKLEMDVLHSTASGMQQGFGNEPCRPNHSGHIESKLSQRKEAPASIPKADVPFPLPITRKDISLPPSVQEQVNSLLSSLDSKLVKAISYVEDALRISIQKGLPNMKPPQKDPVLPPRPSPK